MCLTQMFIGENKVLGRETVISDCKGLWVLHDYLTGVTESYDYPSGSIVLTEELLKGLVDYFSNNGEVVAWFKHMTVLEQYVLSLMVKPLLSKADSFESLVYRYKID